MCCKGTLESIDLQTNQCGRCSFRVQTRRAAWKQPGSQHDGGEVEYPVKAAAESIDAAGSFLQCDRGQRVGDSYGHLAYRLGFIGRGSPISTSAAQHN